MEYKKPVIVAQNNKNGSFAAGCPAKDNCRGGSSTSPYHGTCQYCERAQ